MHLTIAQIAAVAGVSVATVSRALHNNGHPVKRETRQRIIALANEMGYEPNLVARGLRKQQTFSVGVIVDMITSPFVAATIQGFQAPLKQSGYHISMVNSDREPATIIEAIQDFNRRRADGILLLNSRIHTYNDIFLALLRQKPFVIVNRIIDEVSTKCVGPDDRLGAQMAVEHLAELGHSRIAYINGMDSWSEAQNRLAGYLDTVEARGLDAGFGLVQEGNWAVESGYRATQLLLALQRPPTAIFAANDLMALGAIYALQEAGRQVPEDVAVVGFDDRDFARWVRPGLTTVRMPSYEMGEAAANLLLGQFEEEGEPSHATIIPGRLIVRQSCGAEAGG